MKRSLAARALFGVSAVLYGVFGLLWHGSELWHDLGALRALPFGTFVAWSLAIAQVAGGAGMLASRTRRPAAFLLLVVYTLFSLACLPAIVAGPGVYVHYGNFFEQFSLVCGALAAYLLGAPGNPATLARLARLGMGCCAVSFALAQAVYATFTASLVPAWLPFGGMVWTVLTTVAFALAAAAILIDRQARLALRLMSAMIVVFGLLVWVPQVVAASTFPNWSEFALNFLIAAAAWVVSELSGPSVKRRGRQPF